jgi:hypothetical protein
MSGNNRIDVINKNACQAASIADLSGRLRTFDLLSRQTTLRGDRRYGKPTAVDVGQTAVGFYTAYKNNE